jgi:hypothetical protein
MTSAMLKDLVRQPHWFECLDKESSGRKCVSHDNVSLPEQKI